MIREAGWEDIPRLMSYISEFHLASPWAEEAFSPSATRTELQNLISWPSACVFIHDHGVIGGHLMPLRFGKSVLAQEIFWWAEKDGMALFRRFEQWAEEHGADLICMAGLSGSKIGKLYERRGYERREVFYVRHI